MSENNRRINEYFLPACPLWTEWDEFDGAWKLCLRNVAWIDITEFTLWADGKEYTVSETIAAGECKVCSVAVAAHPGEYYLATVTAKDGVCWKNKAENTGEAVLPAQPVDTQMEDFDEFSKAWAGAELVCQPCFTEHYWRCGCGQINDIARTECGKCRKKRKWVYNHRDGEATVQANIDDAERAEKERLEKLADEQQKLHKRRKIIKWCSIFGSIGVLTLMIALFIVFWAISSRSYAEAQAYLELDRYYEAYDELSALGGYGNSEEVMVDISRKLCAETSISGGERHLIKNNRLGKVVGVGYALDGAMMTDKWNAIRAVSAGKDHSLGLHYSGTVMAVGNKKTGACDVVNWMNIIRIGAGNGFSVGLVSDGTVVATGKNDYGQCSLKSWSGITEIAVGEDFVLGLKEDGTVVAAGNNEYGQCDVSDWTDIIYITAGNSHALGVKADGTVVAAGRNKNKACDVSDWTDIVAVTAGNEFTVGLKTDGTLIATGKNDKGQTEVSELQDIIGVVSGWNFTVAIRPNGSVKFIGTNEDGEGNIAPWTLDR